MSSVHTNKARALVCNNTALSLSLYYFHTYHTRRLGLTHPFVPAPGIATSGLIINLIPQSSDVQLRTGSSPTPRDAFNPRLIETRSSVTWTCTKDLARAPSFTHYHLSITPVARSDLSILVFSPATTVTVKHPTSCYLSAVFLFFSSFCSAAA